jgi:hypothetical protein
MLVFVSILTVFSAEPTAVMVQSRSGIASEELRQALVAVDALLADVAGTWTIDETRKHLKASGHSDAVSCAGKLRCLLGLAVELKARWLVTVSVSKIGRDRAWALAAYESTSGTQLTVEEWLDESNDDVGVPVSRFVKRLAPLLSAQDTPVVVKREPAPLPLRSHEPAPGAPRLVPKVFAFSSVILAAIAMGLAIGAGVSASPLNHVTMTPEGLRLSSLSQDQATQRVAIANTLTGTAIASGVVAAALGVVAFVTW